MTSAANGKGQQVEDQHELQPLIYEQVPWWLPELMAGGLSSWFLRMYGQPIPDAAMPGVMAHMRAVAANLIQGAMVGEDEAELVRAVQRKEGLTGYPGR